MWPVLDEEIADRSECGRNLLCRDLSGDLGTTRRLVLRHWRSAGAREPRGAPSALHDHGPPRSPAPAAGAPRPSGRPPDPAHRSVHSDGRGRLGRRHRLEREGQRRGRRGGRRRRSGGGEIPAQPGRQRCRCDPPHPTPPPSFHPLSLRADAAAATLLALAITDYGNTSIGGEIPLLIYDAELGQVSLANPPTPPQAVPRSAARSRS